MPGALVGFPELSLGLPEEGETEASKIGARARSQRDGRGLGVSLQDRSAPNIGEEATRGEPWQSVWRTMSEKCLPRTHL